jgi:glycerophosphoryl diester phosphodiesterase
VIEPLRTEQGAALAIAHRAGNSLSDLRAATELGADVIEADVHAYRGRLEVRHARTLGPLPWLWDDWELTSARAPRLGLRELLLAADRGVTFMLDLKGQDARVGEEVARELHERAPDQPVLVCSRHWPALTPFESAGWARTIYSARTRAELAPLLQRKVPPPQSRGYGVSVHRSLLTQDVVAALHDRVQVVMTWPVNDVPSLDAVLAYRRSGTVGVISDENAILRRLLATRA